MTATPHQLLAASALLIACEKVVSAGILPEADERQVRQAIAMACRAFEIPTVAERSEPESILRVVV